jgi:transcription antitermination factor NusG
VHGPCLYVQGFGDMGRPSSRPLPAWPTNDLNSPAWFLLTVRPQNERSVARALKAKGFEVFVPTRAVRSQWSDRLKVQDVPLFPFYVFCRFSPRDWPIILGTFGLTGYRQCEKPVIVTDAEVESLKRIGSLYAAETCDPPGLGEEVQVRSDPGIRGILLRGGPVWRVAVDFQSIGQFVVIEAPSDQFVRVADA